MPLTATVYQTRLICVQCVKRNPNFAKTVHTCELQIV